MVHRVKKESERVSSYLFIFYCRKKNGCVEWSPPISELTTLYNINSYSGMSKKE